MAVARLSVRLEDADDENLNPPSDPAIGMLGKTLPNESGTPCSPQCVHLHRFSESLSMAMEAKDPCTRFHSQQVADLSYAMAKEIGLTEGQADNIHMAGHLHDIGKIGVPDVILQKNGRLSKSEWNIVRRHPVMGAQIVAPIQGLDQESGIVDMILHHHERWDGKGYPHGLRGLEIPLGARILAVADAFSAMMQDRPYRPGMKFGQAVDQLMLVSDNQVDARLVSALMDLAGRVDIPADGSEAVISSLCGLSDSKSGSVAALCG